MTAQAPPPRTGAETVTNMLPRDRAELIMAEHAAGKASPRDRRGLRPQHQHGPRLRPRAAHPRRACGPGRRLRPVRRLLPAAAGRRPAPADARPAGRAFRPGHRRIQGNVLPGTGAPRHPGAPVPRLPPGEHQRIRPAVLPGQAPAAVPAAEAGRPGGRGDPGIVPRPPRRRQPDQPRRPAGHPPALVPRQGPLARRPLAARPAHALGRRRRREPRRDQRLNRRSHQERAPRLRREARPARPGRHRMPPLHRSPPHQQPVPVHLPAHQQRLPQARHLAVRAGNTAVQRQRLPRHPGRRAPGTPAPPPLHHRAARSTPRSRHPGQAGEQSWKRRATALIESNPRSAAESSPQEMFLAAAYPDAIAAAAGQRANASASNLH